MLFLDNLYTITSQSPLSDDSVQYQIRLIPESVIFGAHFPGEPIMPGACIVQLIQELFMHWRGCEVEIAKVNNLKFLSVISPDAVLDLDVRIEVKKQDDALTHIKADITRGGVDYTKMSLLLHHACRKAPLAANSGNS